MIAVGTRVVEGRAAGDPLRRVILTALALYLMPVALVVLVIGGAGMACCSLLRWAEGRPRRDAAGTRRDEAAQAVRTPHLREASRTRSSNR